MKDITSKIGLVLSVAILSAALFSCYQPNTTTADIDREAKLREEWQTRALVAEAALESACDLLSTAYIEQDELNGPWYPKAGAFLLAICGVKNISDPVYRGRDADGHYNIEKQP